MDISETWKKLGQEKLERPIEGNSEPGNRSRHPLAKLKRNYKIKAVMMFVFLLSFEALYFLFDEWLIRGVLLVLVAAYIIFLLASLFMHKSLRTEVPLDDSLLNVLTQTKDKVSKALRFETISSLLIFPFAGAAGYLMGYKVSGLDPGKVFGNANQVMIFIGTLLIFSVLGYFLGKRLTKEGYGKYLDEIEGMIQSLKGQ